MPKSPRIPAAAAAAAVAAAAFAGTTAAGAAAAAPKKAPAAGPAVPQVALQKYTLPNGLRVVLAPDDRKEAAPVIAVNVTYAVGSRNERPGRSGFAHLFEHLMFQGSENVGKGEHFYLISSNGGTLNGNTTQDRTTYFEAMPANQLELALFLEADRMRALDVSQENLDNQRSVVQEEKRQSYDNQPYGQVNETLLDLAYASFPYKHTTIGSMADLDAATLADVRAFHNTYYVPNNAVLTVSGRFDPGEARALIARYYAPIPKGAAPPPVTYDEPAAYPGPRSKTLSDPLARQPQYRSGYVTVGGTDPDYFPLSILGDILAGGQTSRLYQSLVEKDRAISVGAGQIDQIGPGLFTVVASLPAGGDPAAVGDVIDAEIERVQKDGVTPDEVATALAEERVQSVRTLQTAVSRANRIGVDAAMFDDPDRINTLLPRLQAVTPADVQRVARKYLVAANRSVVTTQPAAAPGGGAAAAAARGGATK